MPFLREKAGRWSPEKIIAFAAVIAPALWLTGRFLVGDLSQPKPATLTGLGARPVNEAILFPGRWAVRFILLALAITPARRLFNLPKLINARRTLGVAGALYICAHFTLYVADQKFDLVTVASEVALRFYLTIGFVGLICLIALAMTSTDAMVRRLGHHWNQLHRLAYVIGVIAVVHFALQKKLEIYEPVLMTGFLMWLLAFRVVQRYAREVTFPWLIFLALFSAAFTALYEAGWFGILTGVSFMRVLSANVIFIDVAFLRPSFWVLVVTLTIAFVSALVKWLRPRQPARVRLKPAE
jgi:sulfoxide reductase heme-binding subunit YedZ